MLLPHKISPLEPLDQLMEAGFGVQRKLAVVTILFLAPSQSELDSYARVLLTRRSRRLRSHKGQVSFAGGHVDPGETLVAAARRELTEEVGYHSSTIDYMGALQPLVGLDGTAIVPLVAQDTDNPDINLEPNPDEVEEIFLIPWLYLTADRCQTFEFNVFGIKKQSYSYQTPYCNIWGLTALMLKNADFRQQTP